MSESPHPPTPENTSMGLERIVFFSDAVMAIAITLLAIELRVPEISPALAAAQLPTRLGDLLPQLGSFFISFVVIGVYWNAHHRYFSYINRYDTLLIALNMVFLLFIVLMPFVASLLGQYAYLPLGVIVYALAVSLTGLSLAGIWFHATYRHRLVDEHLEAQVIRYRLRVALFSPLVFLISIPFAWISPSATMTVWWAATLFLIAITRLIRNRRGSKTPPEPEEGDPTSEATTGNQGR